MILRETRFWVAKPAGRKMSPGPLVAAEKENDASLVLLQHPETRRNVAQPQCGGDDEFHDVLSVC
jgi:hypothetical protein